MYSVNGISPSSGALLFLAPQHSLSSCHCEWHNNIGVSHPLHPYPRKSVNGIRVYKREAWGSVQPFGRSLHEKEQTLDFDSCRLFSISAHWFMFSTIHEAVWSNYAQIEKFYPCVALYLENGTRVFTLEIK